MKPEKACLLLNKITNNDWVNRKEILKETISIVHTLIHNRTFDNKYFASERLQISNLLLQKVILHGSTILNLVNGIVIPTKSTKIIKLKDPISMNVLFRGLLESYLTLNHLNFSETEEENEIKFKIWIQYGLRQRSKMKFTELQQQASLLLEKEKIDIETIMNEVTSSSFYKTLDNDKQETFLQQLERDWKLGFRTNTYIKFSWQELLDKSGINAELFSGTYNLLSWFAHSTCISLWQLNEMYEQNRAETETINIMKDSAVFIALACTDLLKKDKELKFQYDRLLQDDKDLINMFNFVFRDETYSIDKIKE
jgi:hypothetical protein